MFVEMQTLLYGQRARTFEGAGRGDTDSHLTQQQIVEFATLRGAANAALDHRTGSLTPGKDADVILISASDFNTAPVNNVLTTLLGFAIAATSTAFSSQDGSRNGEANSSGSTSTPSGPLPTRP